MEIELLIQMHILKLLEKMADIGKVILAGKNQIDTALNKMKDIFDTIREIENDKSKYNIN